MHSDAKHVLIQAKHDAYGFIAIALTCLALIVDEPIEELVQLSTDQLEQLVAVADLLPDELVVSELGEIPAGNQTAEGIIELLIRSISE